MAACAVLALTPVSPAQEPIESELEQRVGGGRILPVRPLDDRRWEAALVLRFSIAVPLEGANKVEFRAKLSDDAQRPIHTVFSALTVTGDDRGGAQSVLTIERIEIEPGTYDLSIRIDDPGVNQPQSAVGRHDLPPLPRRGLVIVEPMLLRPAREDGVMHWPDDFAPLGATVDPAGFEPVFPGEPVASDTLHVLTRVCLLGSKRKAPPAPLVIERRLAERDGTVVATLDPVQAELTPSATATCHVIFDPLPRPLEPGAYRYEVSVITEQSRRPAARALDFTVE